jgi:hypothetical protein
MVQDQVVPLNFGQGVDTKTDPKAVVAGKWMRLENGVFTNPMSVRKRNGYVDLSGLCQRQPLRMNIRASFLAADQNYLKSYSPSQAAWVSRGRFTSVLSCRARPSITRALPLDMQTLPFSVTMPFTAGQRQRSRM